MSKDDATKWLRGEVAKAMGLEEWAVEGVIHQTIASKDKAEAVASLLDFLGDAGQTLTIVEEYLRLRGGPSAEAPPPTAPPARTGGAPGPPAGPPPQAARRPQTQELPGYVAPPQKAAGASEEVLPNVVTSFGREVQGYKKQAEKQTQEQPRDVKGKGKKKGGGNWTALSAMEGSGKMLTPGRRLCECQAIEHKLVGNCLHCGRIICEQEGLGPCLYCGIEYTGRAGGRGRQAHAATGAGDKGKAGGSASGQDGGDKAVVVEDFSDEIAEIDAATRAAVEQKDKLVMFDRTSAQRTAVIDDQSDYFAIDQNTWLSDQERAALKAEAEALRQAEEEKKKRVTVTFDLIGRKVVMADVAQAEEEAAALAAAVPLPAGGRGAATEDELKQVGAAAVQAAAAAAADHTRRVGVDARTQGPAPIFLPTAASSTSAAPAAPSGSARPAAAGAGGSQASGRSETAASRVDEKGRTLPHQRKAAVSLVKAYNKRQGARGRLQDDNIFDIDATVDPLEAPLQEGSAPAAASSRRSSTLNPRNPDAEAEAWLAAQGTGLRGGGPQAAAAAEEGASAAQGSGFDICLPGGGRTRKPLAPRAGLIPGTKAGHVQVIMEGVAVLKHWLNLEEQAAVVRQIQQLGLGAGGFYVPSYTDGARLSLHMMGLGKHWEPRTGTYHDTREEHDGAAPPGIPAELRELALRAHEAAARACADHAKAAATRTKPLPDMTPEICLANFYQPSGKLGMHQDKSESRTSLARGAPVVSLSIGDAADFHYSMESREDLRSKVVLESGDMMVFGGPARLLYHGVTHIYKGTAPPELLAQTNLRPGRLNLTFREL